MANKREKGAPFSLPLNLQNTMCFPRDSKCPMCQKPFDGAFAVLNAGSLLNGNGLSNKDMEGFCSLTWHGNHSDADPTKNDVYAGIDIVDSVKGGQFDIYCCSTSCMRAFFNRCVDDLEADVTKRRIAEKRRLARLKRKALRAAATESESK